MNKADEVMEIGKLENRKARSKFKVFKFCPASDSDFSHLKVRSTSYEVMTELRESTF